MRLEMPAALADRYKSASQRARVVSEAWGEDNLYCANCTSSKLAPCPTNTEAVDFICPQCDAPFQLKSQSRPFSARVTDAGFDAMARAIRAGRNPNLFVLHYDVVRWHVLNLLLVPRFSFLISTIEKRKPLSPSARRSGWIGCNIVLRDFPIDAKIPLVSNGVVAAPAVVRRQFERLRPLESLKLEARGWTLDVLNIVRGLGKAEFTLAEVYAREAALARLHPDNLHVRDKIRQQLQALRDLGFVEFLGGGNYRFL